MNIQKRGFLALAVLLLLLGASTSFPAPGSGQALPQPAPSNDVQQAQLAPHGQVGGMIYASAVQGGYAYIGIGPRLVVWNVANPAQPAWAGQSAILPGVVRDVEVVGNYAYAAMGEAGVAILDISTPTAPTRLGDMVTYGEAVGVAISGNYAYVASVFDELRVFDVSNPNAPVEVGSYGGVYVAEGIDVVGSYAYVAAGGNGLQILDVSDPANPSGQGTYDSTYAREVVVSGDYAYLADGYGDPSFLVVNVASPMNPVLAGSYAAPGEAYDLVLEGSIVYLASWSSGIRLIDVSNPASPSELGACNTTGRAEGVAVAGGYAYVGDTWDGLKIVDVADPANPSIVYAYHSPGEAWDVLVDGSTAYLADRNRGFYVLDVSDPGAPAILSYYEKNWYGASEPYLGLSGEHLFVVDRQQLHIFDVSDPSHPSPMGTYTALSDPKRITVVGDYAYVADGEQGLRVLDVADPGSISEVGLLDTGGDLQDVLVKGDYAYLADGANGLRVVDVSDPAAPAEVGFFVPTGFAGGVALSGHYAYLSAGWNGLRIINVSNPSTPTEIGFLEQMMSPHVAAAGGYTYVVANQFEALLQQLDVSDPVSPTITATYSMPLGTSRFVVAGGELYAAAGGGGLMAFQVPAAVELEEVRPHQGRPDWANLVDVYGQNLDAGAQLSLLLSHTIPLSSTQLSSSHLRAVVPAGLDPGSYDLWVENPDGGWAVLENAYQVLAADDDLLFAYSDELWTGPTTPRTFEQTAMGLVVHRLGGDADLSQVSVDFYDGDPDAGGTLLGTGTIAGLPPDSYTSTTSIAWTPQAEGFYDIYARINPPLRSGSRSGAQTVHRLVWVEPPALDEVAPTVDALTVDGGAVDVSGQNATLSISASDNAGGTGVGSIYLIEFGWNPNTGEWLVLQESGWLDYSGAAMQQGWTLVWSPGVRNIVAWAADRSGNISLQGRVVWFNFVPPAISVNQGQFQMFCYWLGEGQSISAQTTPTLGDPDLYLGNSSGWLDYSINEGTAVDSVSLVAPSSDLYSVAVYGYATSRYALARSALGQGSGGAWPRGGDPIAPPVIPDGQPAPLQRGLPPAPVQPIAYRIFLPLAWK
ncbi:MAG: hypothetical protein JXA37_03610 [Chloroflexia bacterium]|nr:hypothetical protein [Chloroflexia bacterium]